MRWIHVASMALLLGGASLLWGLAVKANPSSQPIANQFLLFAAERYELLFWTAIGLIVISGIGNLGALGLNLPNANTLWGGRLALKLVVVLLFILLSLLRTLLIARLDAGTQSAFKFSAVTVLRNLYAGTVFYVIGILFLAILLAHRG